MGKHAFHMTGRDMAIKANLIERLNEHFVGKSVKVKWNNGRYIVHVEGLPSMISYEDHDDTHILIPYDDRTCGPVFSCPRLAI